ncbi:MAG: HPF/RaiA family ribosome-associated protein [Rhodothermales bacterium]
MNVTLQGTHLELTEELRALVMEKVVDCFHVLGDMNLDAVFLDIELERTTRRHPLERDTEQQYRAEALVNLPGHTIRTEGSAPDVEQAIVQLKHSLSRELREWRERVIDRARKGGRDAKKMLGEESV